MKRAERQFFEEAELESIRWELASEEGYGRGGLSFQGFLRILAI